MTTASEASLQVHCLGRLDIRYKGKSLSQGLLRKAQALLIYLILEPGRHERDFLAALLWSDMPDSRARANLRTALSRLRHPLEQYLDTTHRTVAFKAGPGIWVDVAQLERVADAGSPTAQREALALYQGDFLDEFTVRNAALFEEWVLLERERLRELALGGLSHLAESAFSQNDYRQAIADLRRLLALDPWREASHRALMQALAASGDRTAALAQFDRCRQVLLDELAVEPAPATVALYEQIKAGGAATTGDRRQTPVAGFSPTSTARQHSLPAETTPFVGREAELAQIAGLLADPGCRLLTLFGAGGIGKTRLALQAARRTSGRFAHGVALVPLETIEAIDLLVTTIADALDAPLTGGQDPKTQLVAYLQRREMLLVLDNFEQLLPGSGLLVELLEGAPGLKFLVTSREALNLYEEWLLEVEGLSYPPEGSTADPNQFDAVSLFLQRAQRVDLGFSLEGNEVAVADICRRLLGMPLGIELAAAWVRTIPCAEIARQITASLEILNSSLRNVPARHRSMVAVFDHSWELLRPEERQLLRRLSVFHGGFRASMAHEVVDAGRRELSALVDKALLRMSTAGRYEIHPLLRQYAAAKLATHEQEKDEVEGRHGQAFAAFLQQREHHLHDEQQQTVLAEVYQEIDNVRAGWQWALANCQPAVMAAYLETMASAYLVRAQFDQGRTAVQRAVERLQNESDQTVLVARLLTWEARFALLLGQFDTAESCLTRAVTILRPLDEPTLLGRALTDGLGQLHLRQGAYAKSIQYLEEGLRLLEIAEDAPGQAAALLHLGMSRFFLEGRESEVERALAIYQQLGDRTGMARALVHLGNLKNAAGEYDTAETYYEQGLRLNEETGDRHAMASCLINLATIAKRRGETERSRELSRQSLEFFRETGGRYGVATALNNLGDLARAEGDNVAAEQWYVESLSLRREIGDRVGEGLLLHNLGRAALGEGEHSKAVRYLREALTVADGIGSNVLLMQVVVGVACYMAQTGERERAAELLTLTAHHPAGNRQTRDEAAQLLAELAQELPASSVEAAQSRADLCDLSQVAADLLQWL